MPTEKLPIFSGQLKNLDEVALSTDNFSLIDGYIDEKGYANVRPGLEKKAELHITPTLSSSWDGLYWWGTIGQLIGVWNGSIYRITYPAFGFSVLNNVTLPAGVPVTFAEDIVGHLFLAAGGSVVYLTGTGGAYHPSPNISSSVTHVAFLNQRLIISTPTNRFQYSAIGDSLTVNPLSVVSAEADYDPIVAIYKFNQEIFVFGRKSTEIWESGDVTDFQRVAGGVLQVGCIAPYSVVSNDNALLWLSDYKRFVAYDGRQIVPFSTAFDKELDNISDPTDCVGTRIEIGGQLFMVFRFQTAKRTFVFNAKTKEWAEWSGWNQALGQYDNFVGRSYAYIPDYGAHIWGEAGGSKIFQMTEDCACDDTQPVRFELTTGFIDYGVTKRKRTEEIRFRLRRGEVVDSEAQLLVRINTDRRGWGNERPVSLGETGETSLIQRIRRTGIYRARQYKFVAYGVKKFSMGGVEEDFTWLD
jgi:hypothetical protein